MKKKSSKQKIKLAKFNVVGIKHKVVCAKMEGVLTYIGTFCIKGEYSPRAFYHNANPNLDKNHKDYMTLQRGKGRLYVSGIDFVDLQEWQFQNGIQCLDCKDVIYSVYRHDCRACKCGAVFIDGGREYTRIGYGGPTAKLGYEAVIIDLLNGTWLLEPASQVSGQSTT